MPIDDAHVRGGSDRCPLQRAGFGPHRGHVADARPDRNPVDCFQEQQAAVAIYSMTSSSPEEAPWAMEVPATATG